MYMCTAKFSFGHGYNLVGFVLYAQCLQCEITQSKELTLKVLVTTIYALGHF